MQKIRHIAEYVIVKIFYITFSILPISIASAIGGFIGRSLGPLLSVHRLAKNNMRRALPDLTEKQIDENIMKMWDNLGRTVGEFPHMTKYKGDDYYKIVEIEGAEHIKKAGEKNTSTIFFSGHFANWEIVPKTIFEAGCPSVSLVYRKSNNPYLDKMILDVRSHYSSGSMPKGRAGARQIINAIKNGKSIGMLIDQKQNDGIAVPFFGREAMTAPAIANLALKYDFPLIPLQLYRTKGAKFKIKAHKPIKLENTGNEQKDILNAMTKINKMLEDWIKQHPEQWFWVHNRWPKGKS